MKERKKLLQNHELCTKEKVHIMNFLDEEKLSERKRRSFSTQEVGRKICP